jgi:hypothetical protein
LEQSAELGENAISDAERFRQLGLGESTKDQPISIELAEKVVREELDLGPDDAIPGASSFWDKFRKQVVDASYIADRNAIPKNLKCKKAVTCREKHYGLCATDDAAIFAKAMCVYKQLQQIAVSNEHRFIMLAIHRAGGSPVTSMFLYVAFARASGSLSVFAHATFKRNDEEEADSLRGMLEVDQRRYSAAAPAAFVFLSAGTFLN